MALRLVHTAVRDGIWEAVITGGTGSTAPALELRWADAKLTDMALTETGKPGQWQLRANLPAALMSEDSGLLSVIDLGTGNVIGMLQVAIGLPEPQDLRAEIKSLRDELDVVKDILRRHFK